MNISLRGMLGRAAECLDANDDTGLGFMLRELNKHLEQFRDDPKLVDDFFKLYARD